MPLKPRQRRPSRSSQSISEEPSKKQDKATWVWNWCIGVFALSVAVSCGFRILRPSTTLDVNIDPTASISMVIPVRDEEEFIHKTLKFFENETSSGYIREYIIVDDGSRHPVEEHLRATISAGLMQKVKVIRNDSKEGLMVGRVIGAEAATGSVLVFMDGHCRPMDSNWAEQLVMRLKERPDCAVVPSVYDMDRYSWRLPRNEINDSGSTKMMFDWTFEFKWLKDSSEEVPIMVGGIYAMYRDVFFKTGAYDIGFREWGGENIEQSIRLWMCGSCIVTAPSSGVAHIFNRDPKGNEGNKLVERIQKNHVRAAEVFMGQWSELFYRHHHSARHFKHIMEPDELDSLLQRKQEIAKMNCKPFDYFVTKFESAFDRLGLREHEYRQIRHVPSGRCVSHSRKNDLGLVLKDCLNPRKAGRALEQVSDKYNSANNQFWKSTMQGRVLRQKNYIARQGVVFETTSVCVEPTKRSGNVQVQDCTQLEANATDMKVAQGAVGVVFVEMTMNARNDGQSLTLDLSRELARQTLPGRIYSTSASPSVDGNDEIRDLGTAEFCWNVAEDVVIWSRDCEPMWEFLWE